MNSNNAIAKKVSFEKSIKDKEESARRGVASTYQRHQNDNKDIEIDPNLLNDFVEHSHSSSTSTESRFSSSSLSSLLFPSVIYHLGKFFLGFFDSNHWIPPLKLFISSKEYRIIYFKCLLLNGFIFMGSLLFFEYLITPIIFYILKCILPWTSISSWNDFLGIDSSLSSSALSSPSLTSSFEKSDISNFTFYNYSQNFSSANIADFFLMFLWALYHIFWICPMYCISYLLNCFWYQDLASHTISYIITNESHLRPKVSNLSYQRIVSRLSDEMYRLMLIFQLLLHAFLLYMIPWFGKFLCFTLLCWIYAFYSFEYRWVHEGRSLDEQISLLENNWSYYLGFGFMCNTLTFFFSPWKSSALFAIFFPFFLVMACNVKLPLKKKIKSTESITSTSGTRSSSSMTSSSTSLQTGPPDNLLIPYIPLFNLPKQVNGWMIWKAKEYYYRSNRK